MSEVTNVGMITRDLKDAESDSPDPNSITIREVPEGVEVFEIQGPFFFGAADKFRDVMHQMEKKVPVIILRMRNVPAVDATGLHVLREFAHRCRREGVTLVLSGVHTQPLDAMIKSELIKEIGMENVFGHIDDALDRARALLNLPPVGRRQPFVPSVAREGAPKSSDRN
jgi:SulP family sulfate permease